jgi:hypothetical protein
VLAKQETAFIIKLYEILRSRGTGKGLEWLIGECDFLREKLYEELHDIRKEAKAEADTEAEEAR